MTLVRPCFCNCTLHSTGSAALGYLFLRFTFSVLVRCFFQNKMQINCFLPSELAVLSACFVLRINVSMIRYAASAHLRGESVCRIPVSGYEGGRSHADLALWNAAMSVVFIAASVFFLALDFFFFLRKVGILQSTKQTPERFL